MIIFFAAFFHLFKLLEHVFNLITTKFSFSFFASSFFLSSSFLLLFFFFSKGSFELFYASIGYDPCRGKPRRVPPCRGGQGFTLRLEGQSLLFIA